MVLHTATLQIVYGIVITFPDSYALVLGELAVLFLFEGFGSGVW